MESSLGNVELLLISVTGPQLSVATGSCPDPGGDAAKGRCIFPFPQSHGRKTDDSKCFIDYKVGKFSQYR